MLGNRLTYILERKALNGEVIDVWACYKDIEDQLGITDALIRQSWKNQTPCFGHWFVKVMKEDLQLIESKLNSHTVSDDIVIESSMNFEIPF